MEYLFSIILYKKRKLKDISFVTNLNINFESLFNY